MEEAVDGCGDACRSTASCVEDHALLFIDAVALLNNEKSEEHPVDRDEDRPWSDCVSLKAITIIFFLIKIS